MPSASGQRRNIQRVVVTAVLVGLLVIMAGFGVIAWATTSVDRVERAKEEALVQRRLERSLEQMTEDVNSATVWDDSVLALNGEPDLDWLQANFGDYYADYMHHTVTLTWDGAGRLVHASRKSEQVAPAEEAAFAAAVAPMLSEVRAASREPARRASVGFDAVVNRTAVVRIGQETWLVAASTVVPEFATVRPPTDPVVISAKPIGALLTSLDRDLGIVGARFLPPGQDGEAFVTVRDRAARPLGVLTWTPDRPGRGMLADAAPVVAIVLLLLLAGAVALNIWVNRVTRDIVRHEAELMEARDRAEAANVAKSRFLANVSHELRTPLNGVVGMSEAMAAGELSPIQRSHLDLLRQSAAGLTRMIEHLLDITRFERDEVQVRRTAFDPAATVVAAVDRRRAMAEAKGLSLVQRVELSGWRLGDAGHLDQALGHLIDNAIRYTDHGAVTVTATASDDAIRIVITDTGIGIRSDLRASLFDVFVQGDDSLTKRFDGVGLGLSICRKLVDAMGGRISVESEEGAGSTFIVDLPMPLVEPAPERRAA